ncbi:hypothetical protein SAMN05216570_3383 [Dyella sp. OK004]|uniref:hypothetical protein n=1 Tax=Dyella sp. OK004 TaxID=1855292 RepID=UPI0008E261A1|nr:hypothetical protein [Dyella sp. OK004]SFS16791.1 hypothetical protein SAMN05216570_3383 [Dyella sp. OK004]
MRLHHEARHSIFRTTRRTVISLLAPLLLGLLSSNTYAQWQVADREHIQADAEAWVKQWAQWKQQFDQWEQQYFTMLNVVQAGPAFIDTGQLERRGPDDGMAQQCPEPGALAGKIVQQQNAFCRMLLQVNNNRYNVLVDLNQQIDRRNQEMRAILAKRITDVSSKDLGGLKSFGTEMQTFQANVEHDMNNAEAALKRYASLAETIKQQQAQLTEQAFKSAPSGSGSGLLGGLVQGATLKGALETAKHW